MKFAEHGLKTLVAVSITILMAALFRDVLILAVALCMTVVLIVDAFQLHIVAKRLSKVVVDPSGLNVRLIAGEQHTEKVCIKASSFPVHVSFKPADNWLSISALPVGGSVEVELTVKPMLSGTYSLDSLTAQVFSRLKLFVTSIRIPFNLSVRAYPRVLPWIIRVIGFIVAGGLPELGGLPGKRKGLGLEYYETRQYVVGDPIRFIDWKATARLSKLMVKEFHEETFGSVHVIYDARALGPVTSDVLSALFLSIMLGVAEAGLPIGLTIKFGSEVTFNAESLTPIDALKIALAYVLETQHVSEWDFYEFVEPRSLRRILRVLEEVKAEGLARLLKFRLSEEARLPLFALIRSEGRLDISYVGVILHDSRFLVELADEVRVKGHRLRVFTPSKPWLDAKDLEEAYMIYNSHSKVLSALKNLGVEVRLT